MTPQDKVVWLSWDGGCSTCLTHHQHQKDLIGTPTPLAGRGKSLARSFNLYWITDSDCFFRLFIYIYLSIYLSIYIYIYIYIHTYIRWMCIHMYIYIYMCTCVYAYTYVYLYTQCIHSTLFLRTLVTKAVSSTEAVLLSCFHFPPKLHIWHSFSPLSVSLQTLLHRPIQPWIHHEFILDSHFQK